MQRGKFIALLGINNIGKSTQARMLVERIRYEGFGSAQHIKYPLYDFPPTGPMINEYLRKGNPENLTPREFQMLNIFNRIHFEPALDELLSEGVHVVAEDYTGTGIAWGIGAGVSKSFLLKMNKRLKKEDATVLLDGDRFLEAREERHAHEGNDGLTENVRNVHLELAQDFGWPVVNANRTKEEVHEHIWRLVRPIF